MALLITTSLDNGINLKDAYFRIEKVDGGKGSLMIYSRIYKNQQMADDGKPHIHDVVHHFNPSVAQGSANFIKQGYEYLKSLPEYSNSFDA